MNLAYVAGFLDGEGCIGFTKSGKSISHFFSGKNIPLFKTKKKSSYLPVHTGGIKTRKK